jgi:cbb3-type cytochrome oxidase subunit 3
LIKARLLILVFIAVIWYVLGAYGI